MSSFFFKRVLVLFVLTLVVSGCAAKVPPPLTADERNTYEVQRVVVIAPKAEDIWWGTGDRAVLTAAGVDVNSDAYDASHLKTEEGQTALRDMALARSEKHIKPALTGALAGEAPAQLSVQLEKIFVASIAQRVVFGGDHHMIGTVQLFDLETGAPITERQRLAGLAYGGGGLASLAIAAATDDPIDQIARGFSAETRKWLTSTADYQSPFTEEGLVKDLPEVAGPAEDELIDPAAPGS